MSSQSAPIFIGSRPGMGSDAPGVGDFQRIVDQVLSALRRRRWLFAVPLSSGMLVTLVVSLFLPRQYEVTASFERRDDPVMIDLIQANSPYTFAAQRLTIARDILRTSAAIKVLDEAGLLPSPAHDSEGKLTPEAQAVIKQMQSDVLSGIRVRAVMRGEDDEFDFIELSYTGTDPQMASVLMNGLRDEYIVFVQQRINDVYRKSHEFFLTQANARNKELTSLKTTLAHLQAENPGIDPSQPNLLNDLLAESKRKVAQLDYDHKDLADQIVAQKEYLAELERREVAGQPLPQPAIQSLGPAWATNPRRSELTKRIASVEAQIRTKVAAGLLDAHPDMKELKLELESLNVAFESEPERIEVAQAFTPPDQSQQKSAFSDMFNAERSRAERELVLLERRMRAADVELADEQARIEQYEAARLRLPGLRESYASQLQTLERMESDFVTWNRHVGALDRVITAESEKRGTHFSVLTAASVPKRPFSPAFPSLVILTISIGLGCGTACVFLREFLDRSFRDAHRVKHALGIPVLETIGEIRRTPRAKTVLRSALLYTLTGVQLTLAMGAGTLLYLSLHQPETYVRLVTSARQLMLAG